MIYGEVHYRSNNTTGHAELKVRALPSTLFPVLTCQARLPRATYSATVVLGNGSVISLPAVDMDSSGPTIAMVADTGCRIEPGRLISGLIS